MAHRRSSRALPTVRYRLNALTHRRGTIAVVTLALALVSTGGSLIGVSMTPGSVWIPASVDRGGQSAPPVGMFPLMPLSPAASASVTPMPSATPSPRTGDEKGPAGSVRFTDSEAVALTFDDGPDPVYTPKLLDILKHNGVKATFCLVGTRVRDNPDVVRRIVAEGHTLCNHSWQHLLDLAGRDQSYIRADLNRTNEAIHAAAPGAPISYFRAPGGNFTTGLVRIARELGMGSLYWDVDPRDWESSKYGTGQSMVDHVVSAVNTKTRQGSIVLSHDYLKPDTIEAYRRLLPALKARFRLVALPAEGDSR